MKAMASPVKMDRLILPSLVSLHTHYYVISSPNGGVASL
jgi:hypothetical protein